MARWPTVDPLPCRTGLEDASAEQEQHGQLKHDWHDHHEVFQEAACRPQSDPEHCRYRQQAEIGAKPTVATRRSGRNIVIVLHC